MNEAAVPSKLRALWALKVTGGLDEELLINALAHPSEDVRAWAVTLLCEHGDPSAEAMQAFIELASAGNSPLVRLSLASGLQRLQLSNRWELASALAARGEDQSDPNIPLMLWYGCEPLIEDDLHRFARLAATASLSRVRINAARRIASSMHSQDGLELLVGQLLLSTSDEIASDLLSGILDGLEGRRRQQMPAGWRAAYDRWSRSESLSVKDQMVRLAVVFEDQDALTALRSMASNPNLSESDRRRAIDALVVQRVSGFDADLIRLIEDPAVRSSALRGLASYQHPRTAVAILEHYDVMPPTDQQDAQITLASRASWAKALLKSVETKRIEVSEITAYTARQIRALDDQELTKLLADNWGEIRATPQDKIKQINSIKQWLTPESLERADRGRGKQLFTNLCASCHQLFGEGGRIGPDITGAQRNNLDYMLENIIDPNASVAQDYQMEMLETEDGRVITGLIESEGVETIAIQTVNERLVLPIGDIAARKKSNVSIMPQGLLEPLKEDEIRDLLSYLQRKH